MKQIWMCRIGETRGSNIPNGADRPMREAVTTAYRELTGKDPIFIFSGWGAELTPAERAVVNEK